MPGQGRCTLFSLSGALILGLFWGMYCAQGCAAYSVLTHEALIDAAWKDGIDPLLLLHSQTPLRKNCFKPCLCLWRRDYSGPGLLSVRRSVLQRSYALCSQRRFCSGLDRRIKDLEEYAFALGALAHYAADNSGHPLATNRAVAIMYPNLAKKYGPVVTYQEKPLRTHEGGIWF